MLTKLAKSLAKSWQAGSGHGSGRSGPGSGCRGGGGEGGEGGEGEGEEGEEGEQLTTLTWQVGKNTFPNGWFMALFFPH